MSIFEEYGTFKFGVRVKMNIFHKTVSAVFVLISVLLLSKDPYFSELICVYTFTTARGRKTSPHTSS